MVKVINTTQIDAVFNKLDAVDTGILTSVHFSVDLDRVAMVDSDVLKDR